MAIWLSSDYHFGHVKPFVYEARGFRSIEDMNKAIIDRHNCLVSPDDDMYILGDLMLMDNAAGLECIKQLDGKLHIIIGNHDTTNRIALYKELPNVVSVAAADYIKYRGRVFFLSHYPCLTGNIDKKGIVYSLFGHTHQTTPWEEALPFAYNVGIDAHNCVPVHIDKIVDWFNSKKENIGE